MKYIFVSSTFRDMQAERDALQNVVMPQISSIARKSGDDIYFRDLRWGINTSAMEEKAANEKILFSCMHEIDSCKPFMLVLLGERYGTSFKLDFIRKVAKDRKEYDLLPRSSDRESVTELEIEYGALSDPELLRHTIFMFREPIPGAPDEYTVDGATEEDRQNNAKMLAELKNKIRQAADEAGVRIIDYSLGWDKENGCVTDIDTFIKRVSNELLRLMEPYWENLSKLPREKAERISHGYQVNAYARQCIDRLSLVEECIEKLKKGNVSIKITGESGSGKSVLFSRIFYEISDFGWHIYPYVHTEANASGTMENLLRQWLHFTEELLGLERTPDPQADNSDDRCDHYMEQLKKALQIYEASDLPPLVLGWDTPYKSNSWDYEYLDALKSKKVSLIFAYRHDEDENYRHYQPVKDHIFLGNYPISGRALLETTMKERGKELHPLVTQKILEKYDSANPLYLTLFIQRLLIMDQNDFRLADYNDKTVDPSVSAQLRLLDTLPPTLPEMFRAIIDEAAERFGREQTQTTVRLLAYAVGGLRRWDIRCIVIKVIGRWAEESFSRLINLFTSLFIEHYDGTIALKTQDIREALLDEDVDDHLLLVSALSHLKELQNDDPIKHDLLFSFFLSLVNHKLKKEDPASARALLTEALSSLTQSRNAMSEYEISQYFSNILDGFVRIWEMEKDVSKDDLSVCFRQYQSLREDANYFSVYAYRYQPILKNLIDSAVRVLRAHHGDVLIIEPYLDPKIIGASRNDYHQYTHFRRNIILSEFYLQNAHDKPEEVSQKLDRAFQYANAARDTRGKRELKRNLDYKWWYAQIQNVYGRGYELQKQTAKSRKAYRKALSTIKRRVEYSFENKQLRWRNFYDKISLVREFFGWRGLLNYGSSWRLENCDDDHLREFLLEDLCIARLYECRQETMIAQVFYEKALEKAEQIALKKDRENYPFDQWMVAVCLQTNASFCIKMTEDSDKFDSRFAEMYTRALNILEELNKQGENVIIQDMMAVILYSLGTLPRTNMDRIGLLDKAAHLAHMLYHKTHLLRYRLLFHTISQAKKKWRT